MKNATVRASFCPRGINQMPLIFAKQPVTGLYADAAGTVKILLDTGAVDPNARPDYADLTNTAGVKQCWASSDKSSQPPEIYGDPDEWYPLHLALTYSRFESDPHEQKRNMARMATAAYITSFAKESLSSWYLSFCGHVDIGHRDTQGRTVLLSACRSAMGADAASDGGHGDLFPRKPWVESNITHSVSRTTTERSKELPGVSTSTSPHTPTLFEYLSTAV